MFLFTTKRSNDTKTNNRHTNQDLICFLFFVSFDFSVAVYTRKVPKSGDIVLGKKKRSSAILAKTDTALMRL
jgi:hypothetical protein